MKAPRVILLIVLSCLLLSIRGFPQTLTIQDTILAKKTFDKAVVYFDNAKYDSALLLFNKAKNVWHEYVLKYPDRGFKDNYKENYLSCLNNIGGIYNNTGKLDTAYIIYTNSISYGLNNIKDSCVEVANLYHNLGLNRYFALKYDLAEDLYFKSLEYYKRTVGEDNVKVLWLFYDFGLLYNDMGLPDLSLVCHLKSLKLKNKFFGEKNIEVGHSYLWVGGAYYYKGDFDLAYENFTKSLNIYIENKGYINIDVAYSFNNLATVLCAKGENDIALDYCMKAVTVASQINNVDSSAIALFYSNAGIIYEELQDYNKAKEYKTKSLQLYRRLYGENHPCVSMSYNNVAVLHNILKEHQLAIETLKKALKINLALHGKMNAEVARQYFNIAEAYYQTEDYDSSLKYNSKAEEIFNIIYKGKHPNKAMALHKFITIYWKLKNYEKSIQYAQKCMVANIKDYDDSLDVNSNPNIRNYFRWDLLLYALNGKGECLLDISRKENLSKEEKIKRLRMALGVYFKADTLIRQVRRDVTSQKDKMLISEKSIEVYYTALQVCNDLFKLTEEKNYIEQAFYFSEECKSSTLLESIASNVGMKYSGIPDSLLQKEHSLKLDISFYENSLSEGVDSTCNRIYQAKLFDLKRSYESLVLNFEKQYPNYYRLKYANKIPSIKEIQQHIDNKSIVMSFFIGDSSLFVFMIEKNKLSLFEQREIKGLNDSIQLYRSALSGNVQHSDHLLSCGNYLFQKLFPSKYTFTEKISNLTIIPDGSLSFIPFESLPTRYVYMREANETENDTLRGFKMVKQTISSLSFKDFPFLIERYNVSYAYSATLFYQNCIEDTKKQPINTSWLAIAPVFEDENKLKATTETKDLQRKMKFFSIDTLSTRGTLLNGEFVNPLPGTEKEVKSIQKEFKDKGYAADVFLKNNANERKIKSGILENYSILHFATHGFVNSEKPELSGLLLAQDSIGGQDGILYSSELYNLKLNADLTVLSACETGLGKVKKGEGIIGLTRALIYAGAKNIVVSLWSVSDQSTSTLMIDFYKNLLNETKKHSYSQWLRNAKMKMIREGKYSNPYYWSPFILVGK